MLNDPTPVAFAQLRESIDELGVFLYSQKLASSFFEGLAFPVSCARVRWRRRHLSTHAMVHSVANASPTWRRCSSDPLLKPDWMNGAAEVEAVKTAEDDVERIRHHVLGGTIIHYASSLKNSKICNFLPSRAPRVASRSKLATNHGYKFLHFNTLRTLPGSLRFVR